MEGPFIAGFDKLMMWLLCSCTQVFVLVGFCTVHACLLEQHLFTSISKLHYRCIEDL